jgi:hypothetical protein
MPWKTAPSLIWPKVVAIGDAVAVRRVIGAIQRKTGTNASQRPRGVNSAAVIVVTTTDAVAKTDGIRSVPMAAKKVVAMRRPMAMPSNARAVIVAVVVVVDVVDVVAAVVRRAKLRAMRATRRAARLDKAAKARRAVNPVRPVRPVRVVRVVKRIVARPMASAAVVVVVDVGEIATAVAVISAATASKARRRPQCARIRNPSSATLRYRLASR